MPGVVDHDQARRISKAIDNDIKVSLFDYLRATSHPLSQREKDLIKKRQKQRRDVKGLLLPPVPPSPMYQISRSCHYLTGTRLQSFC